jgi:hypothetical protein
MSGFSVFTPKTAGTILVAASTSSVANLLSKPPSATAVRVRNVDATNAAYIAFGTSNVAAVIPTVSGAPASTPNAFPVFAGETIILGVAEGVTHVAVICAAGTPNLYFTVGNA